MKTESITPDKLKIGDRIVKTSILNPFPFQIVQRIEKDLKNLVYYVYTDVGWYYTVAFDEEIEIVVDWGVNYVQSD